MRERRFEREKKEKKKEKKEKRRRGRMREASGGAGAGAVLEEVGGSHTKGPHTGPTHWVTPAGRTTGCSCNPLIDRSSGARGEGARGDRRKRGKKERRRGRKEGKKEKRSRNEGVRVSRNESSARVVAQESH